MQEQKVRIPVNPQVTLEGRLAPAGRPGAGAALVLHPHPLYGGSMHNNVVLALAQGARRAGWAVLRINFRGVGASSGRHDHGLGERQDVLAASQWLRRRCGGSLALLAYSFGALVGSQAAAELGELAGAVLVGPPLVLGEMPPWPESGGRLLVLVGEADQFTSLAGLRSYLAGIGARGKLVPLAGADHFLVGWESELSQHTQDFLQGLNPASGG